MSSQFGSGAPVMLAGQMAGSSPNQSSKDGAMMRMLDMSSNGGGGGGGSYLPSPSPLSRDQTSPLGSPRHSPPPRPAPPLHLQLPPHIAGKQDSTSHLPNISSAGNHIFPPPIPLFSSSQPDPFAALQDLRLSYPSINQWLQQVNSNSVKPEPVSPRLEQQAPIPPADYKRN